MSETSVGVAEWKDRIATAAAALGLSGACIFVAQRVAYERFYDRFGLSPEDVGIDGPRVALQTTAGLAYAVALYAVPVAVSAVVLLIAFRVVAGSAFDLRTGAAHAMGAILVVAVFSTCIEIARNYHHADDAAQCAAGLDGQSVRGLHFGLPGLGVTTTRLGIHADIARVRAADAKTPIPKVWRTRKVVYLGTANSLTFVFDRTKHQTFRLAAGSVAVSTDARANSFNAAKGCQGSQ